MPKYQHWYGIYKENGLEVLRNIQVRTDTMSDFSGLHHVIRTDQSARSFFIIASNIVLKEQETGSFFRFRSPKQEEVPLEPGKTFYTEVRQAGKLVPQSSRYLLATGVYSLSSNGIELSNYKLRIASKTSAGNFKIIQDLTPFFPNYPSTYLTLKWAGDLDQDEKPDFMLIGANDNEAVEILFLSSEAEEGVLVRPVSFYYFVDEC